MTVYCPKCEGPNEATAKFCLQCGNDFDVEGPITSTGHDVKSLKDSIKSRDDLSMAEKFDLIAKIEDGANPIDLGIAATSAQAAEESQQEATKPAPSSDPAVTSTFVSSPAAAAAVAMVSQESDAWGMVMAGRVNTSEQVFRQAMDLGMEASHHIHDISHGGIDETNLTNEDLRAIPVLKPPKRSFCPKCGSDILSHSNLQWKKWRDHSAEVVQVQAQAAMEASLVQIAAHYLKAMDALEITNNQLEEKLADVDQEELAKALEPKIRKPVRAELEKEYQSEAVAESDPRQSGKTATRTAKPNARAGG
nr:zinc ribbon domain-containing protein [Euryarchaeota archaeon]